MAAGADSRLKRTAVSLSSSQRFARVAPYFVPQLDRMLHRVSGGRLSLGGSTVPSLMLTTIGAKTGQVRQTPLATMPDGASWYVVGSNYGRADHPAWTANLLAHPDTEITYKASTHRVHAHLLSPQEKAEIWPKLLHFWPAYETYTERSGRDLRVFRLDRR
jgi:deazaflavin-dependent oxidoreductase (nitroreductase family)